MSNSDEIRWKQRFNKFSSALSALDNACAQDSYSELERTGVIQTFNFCFKLSWKVLQDLLYHEGFVEKVPRSSIRRSFEAGYIGDEDCEILLEALKERNVLSHTYNEEVALEALTRIKNHYHPVLKRLHATLLERNTR